MNPRSTTTQHRSLALACLLAITPGCASLPTTAPERPRTLTANDGLKNDTGVVRTDFHSEVGASQEVGVHLDLARAMETQGNFEAAVGAYQKALDAAEKPGRLTSSHIPAARKAMAHRHMASALDRLGRFAQSEAHYREALRLSPNDPKVWNDAGYSAYLQARHADAERMLRTASRLAPDDPRPRTNLGLCLAAAGKTDEALEALSQVGGPAIGHANLAYILAASGKTEEARRHYAIALKFQPELAAARAALAKLDAGITRPDDARLATAPGDASVGRVADRNKPVAR